MTIIFQKKFDTLYNLFFSLFSNAISTKEAAKEQNEMIKKEELKDLTVLEEKSIEKKIKML